MKFKNWIYILVPGVLVAMIFTASTASSLRTNDIVKLGVITPLTGSRAVSGQAVKNGIELAVQNYNAQGGILGKKIETVVYDSQSDANEARDSFEKLVNNDKVDAVIGEIISSISLAMAPLSEKYNIPMITPSSSNINVTKGYKTVFRMVYTDPYQGKGLGEFAYDKLNTRKAAVMYNAEDEYSTGLAEAFRTAFEAKGGNVVNYEGYTNDTKDFSSILTNVKANNPDILFIPDFSNTAAIIAEQAEQEGIDIPLLGGDGWEAWQSEEKGDKIFEGNYFSNYYAIDEPTPENRAFVKEYINKYKETPSASAALGYDTAVVLLEAMKKAGTTEGDKVIEWLEATNLTGVTGDIKFDREHNPIKPIYIFKIENGENVLIQKVRPR